MPERAVPWTQTDRDRQSRTLRRLRASAGLNLTPAAAALGVSASQLSRYESGQTPMPPNLVGPAADLYGADRRDVLRSLGLLDDADPIPHPGHEQPESPGHGVVISGESLPESGWDFRAELLALLPADDQRVIDALALAGRYDENTERAIVGLIATQVARARSTPNDVSAPRTRRRRPRLTAPPIWCAAPARRG